MLKYESTLTRPSVLEMIGLDVAEVVTVLDELAGICTPVGFDYLWRRRSRTIPTTI
jgi:hypothetical protein